MTYRDEAENVRVVDSTTEVSYLARTERTAQQKHTDMALHNASETADACLDHWLESIEWMRTLGPIPEKFANVSIPLKQWIDWIAEQRRLKQ